MGAPGKAYKGFDEAEWIWKDGDFIRWHDARVHILSLAVQFGSSVFEGIRAYETSRGPAVFRLPEHIRRLYDSCAIYRMRPEVEPDALLEACLETIRRNDLEACYVRPMAVRGYGSAGLNPLGTPIETYVAAWPWGTYLGADALEQGVDVRTSSWFRPAPNTYPVASKSAGHYNNSQLMKMEAVADGYAEAIALGPSGLLSEGSGQNLFLVRDGRVITPFLDGTSLAGITRDAVLTIAGELGYEVREQLVPKESLYIADEIFFTGTASEITPVRSVDRIEVGEGRPGPVTRALQDRFMEIVKGEAGDPFGWLTYVDG